MPNVAHLPERAGGRNEADQQIGRRWWALNSKFLQPGSSVPKREAAEESGLWVFSQVNMWLAHGPPGLIFFRKLIQT